MRLIPAFVALMIFAIPAAATQRYVNADLSTGLNNGSSWANAFGGPSGLQAAIDAAALAGGGEVWARASTTAYSPITLADNVKVIGGFNGTETLASQSNPWLNITKISGGDVARCVTSVENDATAVLRGFDLRDGFEPGDLVYEGGGGIGIFNSSPTIIDCAIHDCYAPGGGAIAIYGGDPTFYNCKIYNNGFTPTGLPPPNNYEYSLGGGAVFMLGEYHSGLDPASAYFDNCLFYGNKSYSGNIQADSQFYFNHCTITANEARLAVGGILTAQEAPVLLRNSILRGNLPSTADPDYAAWIHAENSNIGSGFGNVTGSGNINADPKFVNAAAKDYRLKAGSPCINTGDDDWLPPDTVDLDWDGNVTEDLPKDLFGGNRVECGAPDMGAHEYQVTEGIDCNANTITDGCEIAVGTAFDCNGNGTLDSCDIAAGPLLDCANSNGIPDSCEWPTVPRGACCVGEACSWPLTSCQCSALSGVWAGGLKCHQVTCCPQCE